MRSVAAAPPEDPRPRRPPDVDEGDVLVFEELADFGVVLLLDLERPPFLPECRLDGGLEVPEIGGPTGLRGLRSLVASEDRGRMGFADRGLRHARDGVDNVLEVSLRAPKQLGRRSKAIDGVPRGRRRHVVVGGEAVQQQGLDGRGVAGGPGRATLSQVPKDRREVAFRASLGDSFREVDADGLELRPIEVARELVALLEHRTGAELKAPHRPHRPRPRGEAVFSSDGLRQLVPHGGHPRLVEGLVVRDLAVATEAVGEVFIDEALGILVGQPP
mmetsp:Transcript_18133/g.58593  ORF Transcript_18133/g.58593 Transcript_18133/m.58593 type:complete len:274 (-) Transcript_18133:384-1205(-)